MTTLDRRRLLAAAAALSAAPFVQKVAFAADAPSNQTLIELLAMIPSELANAGASTGVVFTYADLAGQLAAVGAKKPDLNDKASVTAWVKATNALAAPRAMDYALSPDWVPTFGFSMFDVDQSLEYGEPPAILTIYRGAFKPDAIDKALTASGYKTVTVSAPGAKAWSLSADGSLDLTKTANRLALSRMNNVALIGTGTMIAAPTLAALQAMLATAAGQGTPAAAGGDLSSLLGAVKNDLASALLLTGEGIGNASVKQALTGVTFGQAVAADGPAASSAAANLARWEWALLAGSPSEAAALAKSIDTRLKTGKSARVARAYKELFDAWTIGAKGSSPIVTLEIQFAHATNAGIWTQMIYSRDLGFLAGA